MTTSKQLKQQIDRALALQEKGKIPEATVLFKKILAKNPNEAVCIFSLARIMLMERKDLQEILLLVKRGIKVAPIQLMASMRALYAQVLQEMGELEAAVSTYDEALKLDPKSIPVLTNSGAVLQQLGRQPEALERLNQILEIEPDNVMTLSNYGVLLTEFKQREKAISTFEHLLEIDPNYEYVAGMLCFEKMHICDWTDQKQLIEKVLHGVREGRRTCKSLGLMAISDVPNDILIASKSFAEHKFPSRFPALWNGEKYAHKKIRIAYVSADLREHPVSHLMVGVLENHDKSRFETIAISLGNDDNSQLRKRLYKAFDQFIDAKNMGAMKIAQLMRELEIDIAIDLSGYTAGSRTEIFSYRCAPIQVNYLGYPGTMGVDYMDYILADRHVIPEEHREFYSEKVAYLPNSYLPTDANLKISDRTLTRAECGLPETGFVFCSFNHDYKITPQVFEIWMCLLAKVEGSVLWLMKLNEPAQNNLRHEAERHGIAANRLIFAQRVPLVEDHLARYRQADLFLDTYPYNAHTTAADALFAGLPLVTYMGNCFQGRVAGSLLHTLGMPELATHSLADYEALALKLATNPNQLADLKIKLKEQRQNSPLFNTELFCRNIEAAYITMWEKYQNGEAADHFTVTKSHEASSVMTKQQDKQENTIRLHIGGKQPKQGWKIFNIEPDINVDYVGDIKDMSQFADESVDEIYGSHVLEHVSQNEIVPTLKGFFRIIKQGGRLMISVPDLETLCKLFLHEGISKDIRFHIMRMMFGGQINAYDFHYIGLNYEFLYDYLAAAGFVNIERVSSFGVFNDTSDFSPYGVPISLNVIAYKL